MNFFSTSKGLRQRCPLSPLVFILAMEGLSRLIKKSCSKNTISVIKYGKSISVSHSLFVADIMIFGTTSYEEWYHYHVSIFHFCNVFGLSINPHKSLLLENGADLIAISRLAGFSRFRCLHYLLELDISVILLSQMATGQVIGFDY